MILVEPGEPAEQRGVPAHALEVEAGLGVLVLGRVSEVLGGDKKKPRYTAVLSLTSDHVADAQELVERVLDRLAKRWRLDEVVTHTGKPSEIYYLVRLKKGVNRDEIVTAVRDEAGDRIDSIDLESRDAVEENAGLTA